MLGSRIAWISALFLALLILVAINIREGALSRMAAVGTESRHAVPVVEGNVGPMAASLDAGFVARTRRSTLIERTLSNNLVPRAARSFGQEGAASSSVAAIDALVAIVPKSVEVPAAIHPQTSVAADASQSLHDERLVNRAQARIVGEASWWSDKEEKTLGGWCRKRPPYANLKAELPLVAPGTEKPTLTKELAKKHASKDNMLITTYVNYNRLDFAFTFIKHLRALNQPHFLVGALDEKALRGLQEHAVPSFLIESGLTTNDYGWGTHAFRQLGLHKVELVLNLAKTGVDALTVDADAFVLRDPLPYIRELPEADVLMSSDHLVATNGYHDTGLEGPESFHSAFNIGFIFIRANAIEFVQSWRDACFRNTDAWDQVLFAGVLRRNMDGPGPKRLQKMFKRSDGTSIMAGVLPVALFASGHTFFVSRMAHLMHDHPYMVHTTFQYGGAQGKRHRLRESMMWEDSSEYYSADFLTFEPDLPYDLVYPKGGEVQADGTQAS